MTNQALYIWLQQAQDFLETILTFISDNKDAFIVVLGAGSLPLAVRFIWWLIQQHRKRRILPDTFAFDVIKPQSNVLQALLGGDENDSLADYKIPYQERISGRSIHDELKQKLDESRWVLILAPTGLGKTREAANLAQRLNNEGWTILNLKRGQWLDALPRFPEDKIGTDRKLLFFLDDLNSKMYGGRIEQSPKADEPLQRLNEPLQERLLRAMDFYEKSSRKEEIRVIATVRNEKEREFPDEPSEWDHSFSNIVENIRSARNNNQPLGLDTFRDTLKGTWEKRYQEVVKKYPIAPYIYDAVELLQMVGIEIYPFTVKPTALLIADRNLLRRVWLWWQIPTALRYLIGKERILQPRDGQIEAKGTCVVWRRYIPSLSTHLLKLAEKHHSKMLSSLLNFGYGLTLLGRYEDALTSFNKALKIQPNSHDIWRDRGVVLSYLGRHEEAIADYKKAIEFKPDDPHTWYNRAITLADLGRTEEALASYDKVTEFKPDYYQGWINRGNMLVKLNRLEEALSSYDKALECEPDFALEFESEFHLAWVNRGSVLDDLHRYEEAIANCDKALEIKPDDPSAWNIRGVALYHSNRYQEAITSYDEALRLDPEYGKAWENRNKALGDLNRKGIALANLGRFEEAIASFDTILQSQSDFYAAWSNRGIALANLERFEEAMASFDKAIEIKPDDYLAWYQRGYLLDELGCPDKAIASYEQALQFKPDIYEAWYNRGIALYDLGRWEEAIASCDKALEIQPNDANTFYGKACCYALQGNVDLAIENLQQAINLNPNEYREAAKTDSVFDSIRGDNRFQALIQGDTH